MKRRAFLAGLAASLLASTAPTNAQLFVNSAGRPRVLSSGVPTQPPAVISTLFDQQITLTNPTGQPTQTNPFFTFGLPIAQSEFPSSGYKLALYDATGSTKISDLQVDMQASDWADGSFNYCVVTGYATGTTITAGSTATVTIKAIAGSIPTTPVCTLSTLAANSNIFASVAIAPDTFKVSVNTIIANYAGFSTNYPLYYIRAWHSGPYSCTWCFGQYLQRVSDNGFHKWAFLKLYVTALSASGPFIIRGYLENPNSYGPIPGATVGPSTTYSPQIITDAIDIYNGATHICGLSGANDLNNGTFTTSGVNLVTGELAASFVGGTQTARATFGLGLCPIGFVSTGTLPAGLGSASTASYWMYTDPSTQNIVPCLSRLYVDGLITNYTKIANPTAGTSVTLNKYIQVNGATYLSTTAGVSTGRMPTGAVFADNSNGGTLVWTAISAQITSAGSGTHTMQMKAAVWGGSKAPIVGPDTYPFWSGAGSLPKLLIGYNRNYLFGKTRCVPPLDPTITITPWVGPLPRYFQNASYLPGQPTPWYIGNVSESPMDERINQMSPTGMASGALPTDAGLAMSSRFIGLNWTDRNASWRDERGQEVHVVNYGPDRLGTATYPNMPPLNINITVGKGSGSPAMFPYNGIWTGYGGFLGGSSAPDSGHTPNAPYWAALTSGDPLFHDAAIELAAYQLSSNGGGSSSAIRTSVFNSVHLTWILPFFLQSRSAGHAMQIFGQTTWILADAHPAKPYFSDVMDDTSNIGPLWAAANVGPNGQSVGYLPFIYPNANPQWQAEETWMMGYIHFAFMCEILKNNRPAFKSFYSSYFYKSLLPLWDSDVGGSEQLIDQQWDVIGNTTGGPLPPTDAQFLLDVPDRLSGNPVIFQAFTTVPPPEPYFVKSGSDSSSSYIYHIPGSIGTYGNGGGAAFPGNAYGLSNRAVCEMGAMWGFAYATKIADRIQAVLNAQYSGNPCNFGAQAAAGNLNGIMYAMKRQ